MYFDANSKSLNEAALEEHLWDETGKVRRWVLEIMSGIAPAGYESDWVGDMLDMIAYHESIGTSRFEIVSRLSREIETDDADVKSGDLNVGPVTVNVEVPYPYPRVAPVSEPERDSRWVSEMDNVWLALRDRHEALQACLDRWYAKPLDPLKEATERRGCILFEGADASTGAVVPTPVAHIVNFDGMSGWKEVAKPLDFCERAQSILEKVNNVGSKSFAMIPRYPLPSFGAGFIKPMDGFIKAVILTNSTLSIVHRAGNEDNKPSRSLF